jgi:murein DD-endopeptidase MepM/ murein hydrolase activator NlpD
VTASRMRRWSPVPATALLLVLGCTAAPTSAPPAGPPTAAPTSPGSPSPTADPASPTRSPSPAQPSEPPEPSEPSEPPEPTRPDARPDRRTGPDDPRWRFFVPGRQRYTSAWFDGAQRIMIGYGCTRAPYYAPDPRCDGTGFHHGVDVALPCRTGVRAGVAGRVVDPDRPGRPGPAYGSTAFRIRVAFRGERYDVLIGHAARVLVRPGDRVRPGQRIATAGARGAPDGCHLHFEQRRVDGGVSRAVDPERLLGLRPV